MIWEQSGITSRATTLAIERAAEAAATIAARTVDAAVLSCRLGGDCVGVNDSYRCDVASTNVLSAIAPRKGVGDLLHGNVASTNASSTTAKIRGTGVALCRSTGFELAGVD